MNAGAFCHRLTVCCSGISRRREYSVQHSSAADNLYNEQDDQSVHYDGTKWIQPGDWSVSEIDLSAYKGRLVLFSAMSKSRRTTQGAAFIV
ncbi:MAG: hypothetical protein IJ170_03665 [Ruminococcus sp.]|nr:hypothetical protein [Ruminococcus sp.]